LFIGQLCSGLAFQTIGPAQLELAADATGGACVLVPNADGTYGLRLAPSDGTSSVC
jgi:hypothetical protein